jgi:Holliday junction DNA helicase RuvA
MERLDKNGLLASLVCIPFSANMITFLIGKLTEALPNRITIDVNGVGYEVLIPISSFDAFGEPGRSVKVLTHLHIRENEHTLFGFSTDEERDLFRLLINRVSGIGPKLGMAVLSGMSVTNFKSAVINNDVTSLSKISGLGKKTAERIVLELKDKVGVTAVWEANSGANAPSPLQAAQNDAVLALISLGYKQVEAMKAVKKLADAGDVGPDAGVDDFIRGALKSLN